MGQKKEATKTKDDDLSTFVLKLDLHCEGCAKKVKRSIHHLQGVEDVKADYSSGKLTVKGKVDPLWLLEKVANKTKKKVDLLSAQPEHGSRSDDKNSDEKIEKTTSRVDHKKSKEVVKAQVNTVVVKTQLHCDRCAEKVKRIIQKIEGVQEVSVSLEKDLVKMKGTIDIKELTAYLTNKLKRHIDVVLPKKDDGGSGDNSDGELELASIERTELKGKTTEVLNKMEYYGSNTNTHYAMPTYNQNYNSQYYDATMGQDYGVTMHNTGHGHTGYVPPPPPPIYVTAPQMFSDENPNGCSVM